MRIKVAYSTLWPQSLYSWYLDQTGTSVAAPPLEPAQKPDTAGPLKGRNEQDTMGPSKEEGPPAPSARQLRQRKAPAAAGGPDLTFAHITIFPRFCDLLPDGTPCRQGQSLLQLRLCPGSRPGSVCGLQALQPPAARGAGGRGGGAGQYRVPQGPHRHAMPGETGMRSCATV